MNLTRNPRKVCSRLGLALFLMAFLYIGGNLGISFLAVRFFPTIYRNPIGFWLINDIPLYFLGMPVFLLIARTIPEHKPLPPARIKITVGRFLALAVFCLGAAYLIAIITNVVLSFNDIQSVFDDLLGRQRATASVGVGSGGVLVDFIFMVVIPAFGEEFVFRYMLRRKLNGAGDKIYILISGISFGLFHMNLAQTFFTFVVGMAMAWIYTQTNNIWIPVALHFALNFNSAVVMQHVVLNFNSTLLIGLVGLLFIALMIGAIVVFAVNIRKVRASLAPPFEAGWPYKPPKPRRNARLRNAYGMQPYYNNPYGAPAWSAQNTHVAGMPLQPPPTGGQPYYPPQPQWNAQGPGYGQGYPQNPGYGQAQNWGQQYPAQSQPWGATPPQAYTYPQQAQPSYAAQGYTVSTPAPAAAPAPALANQPVAYSTGAAPTVTPPHTGTNPPQAQLPYTAQGYTASAPASAPVPINQPVAYGSSATATATPPQMGTNQQQAQPTYATQGYDGNAPAPAAAPAPANLPLAYSNSAVAAVTPPQAQSLPSKADTSAAGNGETGPNTAAVRQEEENPRYPQWTAEEKERPAAALEAPTAQQSGQSAPQGPLPAGQPVAEQPSPAVQPPAQPALANQLQQSQQPLSYSQQTPYAAAQGYQGPSYQQIQFGAPYEYNTSTTKRRGIIRTCFLNAGMILFMLETIGLTIFNQIAQML